MSAFGIAFGSPFPTWLTTSAATGDYSGSMWGDSMWGPQMWGNQMWM